MRQSRRWTRRLGDSKCRSGRGNVCAFLSYKYVTRGCVHGRHEFADVLSGVPVFEKRAERFFPLTSKSRPFGPASGLALPSIHSPLVQPSSSCPLLSFTLSHGRAHVDGLHFTDSEVGGSLQNLNMADIIAQRRNARGGSCQGQQDTRQISIEI